MNAPNATDNNFQHGVQLLNQGKHAEAESRFRAAVEERPDWAEAHNKLGITLAALGQFPGSLECFRRAVELQADHADAHHNLGNAFRRAGQAKEALDHFREALRLQPRWADACNNAGLACRALVQLDEALQFFRRALRLKPDFFEARNNLGVTLADKGLLTEAAATYRQILQSRPQSVETLNNLGVVLVQLGKRKEAIERYRRAIELRPYADAHNNLGNALRQEGKFEEAEACLREALRLKPDYAEAYNNLAIILVKEERVDEAIANYHQALRLKKEYSDAHKNLGLALLGHGDLAEGWKEYEWRWKTKEMPARPFDRPRWDGSALAGKTILLYAEQGLGDTLQFVRYAALVEQRGGKVILECQKALLALLAKCPGIFRLVAHGEPLPAFDTHCPLLSLPGLLGTTLATIPAAVPYVTPDPERIRLWGQELNGMTGYKIGIAWQGSRGYQDDRFRSIPLSHFGPLARIPGVRLINLQKGYGTEQLRGVASWGVVDFGSRLDKTGGFVDTAALMKHLDLVVTSDTAMAHLAGALGVPVWMAASTAPDWRWLLQREDSPWYPTMRIVRQKKRGDWAEVFERMARELEMRPPLESAARHGQRGAALLNQGKTAEAIHAFQRALELDPKNASLHNNLAICQDREGLKTEAVANFQAAVRLKPDFADALHNLGNSLRRLNRMPEAEAEYRKAVVLLPDAPELCNHLGIALLGQAKHAEAEACIRRSLNLKPDLAEAHNNLGVLLEQQGKVAESILAYQEALRLKPDAADTHKNLALGWLTLGEYAKGWAEYEWRFKAPGGAVRSFPQPRWDGRSLDGQAVLLYAEQGLGDTIQFVRYGRLVKQRGAVVLVEAPAILEKLLARCPGIDRFIPQGSPLPDFAYQAPFLSLPGIFQTTLETVPADVPYLSAQPRRVAAWGQELAALSGLKIGIAWQGSKKYGGDAHRSIPLKEFAPLAALPDVRLISLQKGLGTEQLKELKESWNIVDFGDRLDHDGAFLDTAALMANLDLVVTSDTALPHLAGALGVPVWMALSQAADWRWLRQGDTSPWYPSMRLFRQRRWGDWADVFVRIAAELQQSPFSRAQPILAEIAPGELLDKITILETKRERTSDPEKLQNILIELGGLLAAHSRSVKPSRELELLTGRLKRVNETLWEIEDEIRLHERQQDFGERFIELARSVYKNNDLRAALKRQINQLLGCRLGEVKSYVSYDLEPVPAGET